jgi:hypothetical protein
MISEKAIQFEDLSGAFDETEELILGFENFVKNEEEYHKIAIDKLIQMTKQITSAGLFSPNEEISEIQTENIK